MNGLKAAPITADEVRAALPDATSHIGRDRCGEHNIIRRAVDIAPAPSLQEKARCTSPGRTSR